MTIESQVKSKIKQLEALRRTKNSLIKSALKPHNEVWGGEGRKDYDTLREEINKLWSTMP